LSVIITSKIFNGNTEKVAIFPYFDESVTKIRVPLELAITFFTTILFSSGVLRPCKLHEPDEGEIDYAYIFNLFEKYHYSYWIGCEYNPRSDTQEGLSWLQKYKH